MKKWRISEGRIFRAVAQQDTVPCVGCVALFELNAPLCRALHPCFTYDVWIKAIPMTSWIKHPSEISLILRQNRIKKR